MQAEAWSAGLRNAEARKRLAADGANELPQQKARSIGRMVFATIREPMFALLLASGAIYLVLGSLEEALLLLAFACASVGIAIFQEVRSERVLAALRDLTSPRALVIRDGRRIWIPSREVVRGDSIILSEGDRIPADAIVRQCTDLSIDESLLTGEAVPVRKIAVKAMPAMPVAAGGEDQPFVFSSTLVVRGSGICEVVATGTASKVGQIGKALAGIESATPRLTLETRNVVRMVAIAGAICCLMATILFGLFRGSWLEALLAGIALGMSMIPEEFPLVLTVFTVMGAWRLSQVGVLTRRASAIQTLGSATVLCTDKTGTLTENRMSVAEIRTQTGTFKPGQPETEIPQEIARAIRYGVLASAIEPFDPMEKAFHALHDRAGATGLSGHTLSKVYPLRPELLAVTQVWSEPDGRNHIVAAKGAPEDIAALCRLDPIRAKEIQRDMDEMAAAGMRVLGVAEARHGEESLPGSPKGFEFHFLGLVGLADPLRGSVPAAIQECRSAGIRVIMITGDYPLTALAIAAEAGLSHHRAVTGGELAAMNDEMFAKTAHEVDIFARIAPEQKLRLVQTLQRQGEVVAMTGDGVNDAPALRAADIGVAMGNRGTDVAREASSIVLLDDDFASIVRTVRLGRRIYDNLRKAMGYIIAVHIPIAGMALLPLLTGLPLVFAPVHIAFLEMIIDPACSIVFEAEQEEGDIMQRPPRSPNARLLSSGLVWWGCIQGLAALAIAATVYIAGAKLGMTAVDLRTLTFIVIVGGNLSLVMVNRSFAAGLAGLYRGAGRAFWVVSGTVAIVLAVAVFSAPVRGLFAFGAFHGHDLIFVFLAAALLLLILEGAKFVWPEHLRRALET